MKIFLGLFFILFILFSLCCNKESDIIHNTTEKQHCPNCIVAGDSSNNLFTDLIPDTTLYISGMGEEIYELDLDGNNINDFKIRAYFVTGTSHTFSNVRITPYGNNKIAFNDSIPTTYAGGRILYTHMAQGVNEGDTINNSLEFKNQVLYMEILSFLTSSHSVNANWNGRNYVPVSIELGQGNVYYGWIKVSNISNKRITIESFAVNIP